MAYEIQQIDIDMLKAKFNTVWIKLELANVYLYENGSKTFNSNFKPFTDISGELKDGSFSNDSGSDIRRTLDLDFIIRDDKSDIAKDPNLWINKFIIAYLGVSNHYVENIKYYPLGVFIMNTPSYSYSLLDRSLSLSCIDLVALLNGDRKGVINGVLSTKIEGVPEICNASITLTDNNNKLIVVNIESDYYKPLTKTEEGETPYFDMNIGFNITNHTFNSVYKDYSVYISINRCKHFILKSTDKKIIKYSDLIIGQDYVCNFYGNTNEDYCFILYNPNTISGAMTSVIQQYSPFNYLIETIGSNLTYPDGSNPTYIPYNLDFGTGATQWDIIVKLRDLITGYSTFFDEYGTFCCKAIPTCESDEILLDERVFEPLVISEKSTYELNSIKNVTEVWGGSQETDRYDEKPSITIDTKNKKVIIDVAYNQYACDEHGSHNSPYNYSTSELLGFTMPKISESDINIAINEKYPIYIRVNYEKDQSTGETLPEILLINDYANKNLTPLDYLTAEYGYCFKPQYNDGLTWYAVFYGEFQPHAVCLLVDEYPNAEQINADKIKYNCRQISYIYNKGLVTTYLNGKESTYVLEEDCPYTINKIGELPQVLSGDDYDSIYTTDLARQRAEYEAWKAGRLTDSITIETKLIPFINTEIKIKYKSIRTGSVNTYIIDKIEHSFTNFTTTIEMHKFYATYPFIVNNQKGGIDAYTKLNK